MYEKNDIRALLDNVVNANPNELFKDCWEIVSPERGVELFDWITEDYRKGVIDHVVYDLETSALRPWDGEIIMINISRPDIDKGWAIPLHIQNECHHPEFPYPVEPVNIVVNDFNKSKCRVSFKNMTSVVPVTGHNLKFDCKWCCVHDFMDIDSFRVHNDTLLMAKLIGGGSYKSHTLKALCKLIFKIPASWDVEVDDYLGRFRLVKDRTYSNVPTSILGKYGALDTYFTSNLEKYFTGKLLPQQQHIMDILNYLVYVFTEVEVKGFAIDLDMYRFLEKSYSESMINIVREMRELPQVKRFIDSKIIEHRKAYEGKKSKNALLTNEEISERSFSPGSVTVLRELLYNRYKLPVLTKTDKGEPSCDADTIDMLLKYSENAGESWRFLKLLKNNKVFAKLKSTYIDSLVNVLVGDSYKVEYNINGATTGRHTSGFHTLPKASDIKRLYISRWRSAGGLILTGDFSQLELRIIASLASEALWIEAYQKNLDLHAVTAAAIFGVPLDQVTKDMRGFGKTINFGIIYGKSAASLAEDLNITIEEAQEFLNKFFSETPDLNNFIIGQHNAVTTYGLITNPFGRIYPLPEGLSHDVWERRSAERRSVNYPVQGGGSDVVSETIVDIHKAIKAKKLNSLVVGTVHDSEQFDIYPRELFTMVRIVKHFTEAVPAKNYSWLKCPLIFDLGLGTSWGSALDMGDLSYSSTELSFTSKAMGKDFKMLKAIASIAYNVDIDIIEKKPIDITKLRVDSFVVDEEEWVARMTISEK